MMRPENDYRSVIETFATGGAEIIRLDPLTRYHTIGRNAKRALEPGFIPIGARPKVVTVSFYPNETELRTSEFTASRSSFERWGRDGDVASYESAYRDWLAVLPAFPFHRDWVRPIFDQLDISDDEFAWLPLVKCPLPAYSDVPDDDIFLDRMLLWDQLMLLRPLVILAQGMKAADVVGPMCDGKFRHRLVRQKIGRIGTTAYHADEDERVIKQLRAAIESVPVL